MTPEDARKLIDDAKKWPRRQRRYELEGGQRQEWSCACGIHCIAETQGEASNILRAAADPRAKHCRHEAPTAVGKFFPPEDFS